MAFTPQELALMQDMVDSQAADIQTLQDQIDIIEARRGAFAELDEIYRKFLNDETMLWMREYIQTQKVLNLPAESGTATTAPDFAFGTAYAVGSVASATVNGAPVVFSFNYGDSSILVGGTWPGAIVEVTYTPMMVFVPGIAYPDHPPALDHETSVAPDGTPWGTSYSLLNWVADIYTNLGVSTTYYSPSIRWDFDALILERDSWWKEMRNFREDQSRGTRHICNGMAFLLYQMKLELEKIPDRNDAFGDFLP